MVQAVLLGEGVLRNHRYIVIRTRWTLETSTVQPQTEEEAVFAYLKGEVYIKHRTK